MGRIGKGTQRTVTNCGYEAVRSVSVHKVKTTGLDVEGKRAYLCKEHYKEYKKDKEIAQWRQGVPLGP